MKEAITINYDVRYVHRCITYFYCAVLLFFIFSGAFTIPIFAESVYFRLTPPVEIIGSTLRNWGIYIFASFLLVLLQIANVLTERVSISINHAGDNYLETTYGIPALWIKLFLRIHKSVFYYFNYSTTVIFIRAQVPFFMAIAFSDILTNTVTNFVTMRIKNILKDDWWKDLLPHMLVINTILIVLCPIILFLAGARHSGYFDVGPPLHVFGDTITSTGELIGLTFFLFFDRIVETFTADNVDTWINDILQNTQALYDEDTAKQRWTNVRDVEDEQQGDALFGFVIFLIRGFVSWMRNIFVINFFFDRYFMIFVYILGDAIAGCVSVYYRHYPGEGVSEILPRGSKSLLASLCGVQTVEMIVVLMALTLGRLDTSSYFTLDNPLYFGLSLDTTGKSNTLIALAVIMRIAQTLYYRVIQPDMYHYTYSDMQRYIDPDAESEWIEVVMNTFIGLAMHWVCYLFSIQLITSTSLLYVTIFAAVDIPVSSLVICVYIWKKARMLRNVEYVNILNDEDTYEVLKVIHANPTFGIYGASSGVMNKRKKRRDIEENEEAEREEEEDEEEEEEYDYYYTHNNNSKYTVWTN